MHRGGLMWRSCTVPPSKDLPVHGLHRRCGLILVEAMVAAGVTELEA
jgi:hypothetical protein